MPTELSKTVPLGVVGLAVSWNLCSLRSTTDAVSYLDDASMHEQMVREAATAIGHGQLPLARWFPYLGLGSPHFLHYQSLGAMITATVGLATGPDTAFRWSLYLLLALFPIPIYASARIFGLGRAQCAVAAVASSFLSSVPAVGYEHKAYIWIGYGLWAQLWGSWALPFAWATTWRALEDRRFVPVSAIAIALTAAFHFETAYLAFGAAVLLPWMVPSRLRARLIRAAIVITGALCASAWVTVPLVAQGKWAAVNEILAPTPLVRGYGAGQDLEWLFTGQIFDAGRLPVVSIAVFLGLVACAVGWRRSFVGRALTVLFGVSFMLSFGPNTWGPLVDVVPGHGDIFFRRFLMGVHLSGIYLAGIGSVAAWELAWRAGNWAAAQMRPTGVASTLAKGMMAGGLGVHPVPVALCPRSRGPVGFDSKILRFALGGIVGIAVVLPAWSQFASYDADNARAIAIQRQAEANLGELGQIIDYIKRNGGGRTYAGMPSNWGMLFTVGEVPVFKYLESQDVDEVGYTLRTASLMTDPEYYFDERDPSDFVLFGIRYLILPESMAPPVLAQRVMAGDGYALWEIPHNGYLDVVDTIGTMAANRKNVAMANLGLLRSNLVGQHQELDVAWDNAPAAKPTCPRCTASGAAPGTVLHEAPDLRAGEVSGTVSLTRRAVVMLSASYDPGWQAFVDGHRTPTVMLAPAVVGVDVGPGTHVVTLRYRGFSAYPELFVLSGASLICLAFGPALVDKAQRRRFPIKRSRLPSP